MDSLTSFLILHIIIKELNRMLRQEANRREMSCLTLTICLGSYLTRNSSNYIEQKYAVGGNSKDVDLDFVHTLCKLGWGWQFWLILKVSQTQIV